MMAPSTMSLALLFSSSQLTTSSSTFPCSMITYFSFKLIGRTVLGLISTKFLTFCHTKYLQSGMQTEQKQFDCVGITVLLYTISSFCLSMFSKSFGSYLTSKFFCWGSKQRCFCYKWSKRGLAGPVSGQRKVQSYYFVPRQQTVYSNSSQAQSIISKKYQQINSLQMQSLHHHFLFSFECQFQKDRFTLCFIIFSQKFKQEPMAEKLSITFDEENNIRVLDPEKFRQSDHLKGLSMEFITKVITMDETMSSLTECLDDFAVQIQKEKLRALGERNKWESESENRKRKMMELNNLLNEKKAELERHTVQYESLTKVEAEQKTLINKLSSNQ